MSATAPSDEILEPAWELTHPLLVQVLQHVPIQQRLSSCARVSRAWKEAAAAATASISIGLTSQDHCHHLMAWLEGNGSAVRTVELWDARDKGSDPVAILQMPCKQLQQLCVRKVIVQLGPGPFENGLLGGGPFTDMMMAGNVHEFFVQDGLLPNLPHLTRLELQQPLLLGGKEGLVSLPAATALRDLTLNFEQSFSKEHLLVSLAPDVLPQLSCLTRLQCNSGDIPGVEQLTALQVLDVDCWSKDVSLLQRLPALTGLRTLILSFHASLSSASSSWLAKLTNLQHLSLKAQDVEPSLFSSTTQLTHLTLDCELCCKGVQAGATAALLAILEGCQHLKELRLTRCLTASTEAAAGAADAEPALYAAVTASPVLDTLSLVDCVLPAGAWQHMFSPSRPVMQLTHLGLHALQLQDKPSAAADTTATGSSAAAVAGPVSRLPAAADGSTTGLPEGQSGLQALHIQALAAACPNLISLDLGSAGPTCTRPADALCVGEDALAGLLCIPKLQRLRLHQVSDAEAAAVATLTQLTSFEVDARLVRVGCLSQEALQQLAKLTGLWECLLDNRRVAFRNKAPPGSPPDVSQQLLQYSHSAAFQEAAEEAAEWQKMLKKAEASGNMMQLLILQRIGFET